MCCPTHCASYDALCQLLLRAFPGWIRPAAPTSGDQILTPSDRACAGRPGTPTPSRPCPETVESDGARHMGGTVRVILWRFRKSRARSKLLPAIAPAPGDQGCPPLRDLAARVDAHYLLHLVKGLGVGLSDHELRIESLEPRIEG